MGLSRTLKGGVVVEVVEAWGEDVMEVVAGVSSSGLMVSKTAAAAVTAGEKADISW